MRYKLSICGSYPGAIPFEWYAQGESAEAIAAQVAAEFDDKYPEQAPHFVSAEEDE